MADAFLPLCVSAGLDSEWTRQNMLTVLNYTGKHQPRDRSWSHLLGSVRPELKITINSSKHVEGPGDAVRAHHTERTGKDAALERAFRTWGILFTPPKPLLNRPRAQREIVC